jgi:hypothetical protein
MFNFPVSMSSQQMKPEAWPGIFIGLIFFLILLAASCNREPPYLPPQATIILKAAPIQVELAALVSDWATEPEKAIAAYRSQEIYFKTVRVDDVLDGPGGTCVRSGSIKFYAAVPADVGKVRVGDAVDVVGKCQGMEGDVLVITECWIRVIDTRKPAGY